MKVATSVIWLAFAFLFFVLGRWHWTEAEKSIPPFEVTRRAYELSGSGFQLEIDVGGTPLDQPFENFAEDFNEYLEERNRTASASHRRAAWGYFLAGAMAVASLLLGLRSGGPIAPGKARGAASEDVLD